jgi:hypothetical protein
MNKAINSDFLGAEEDEAIAGLIYDDLPSFEAGNQVNRKEAVKVIADHIRSILTEMREVIEIGAWYAQGHATPEELEKLSTAIEVIKELEKSGE